MIEHIEIKKLPGSVYEFKVYVTGTDIIEASDKVVQGLTKEIMRYEANIIGNILRKYERNFV